MASGPWFKRDALVGVMGRLAVSLVLLPLAGGMATAAEPWPHEVQALYKVRFNGFEVGTFEFNATVNAQAYVLTGNAQLSALLGVLSWKGETRAAGTLTTNARAGRNSIGVP